MKAVVRFRSVALLCAIAVLLVAGPATGQPAGAAKGGDEPAEKAVFFAADGLRQDLDVDRVVAHIHATVEAAVEPRAVAIWRRDGGAA